jgi:outer membrane cobalamin receptor
VDLSEFPLENMERIEVLRGAASSLYGSSAVGGVVNIITKSATKVPTTTLDTKFGTFRTWSNNLTQGASLGNFDYFLTLGNIKSEGHRDNADYQAYNLTTKLNYKFNGENKLTLNMGYYQGEVGTPGKIANPDLDDRQKSFKSYIDLSGNFSLVDGSKLTFKSYQNFDRLEFIESLTPLDKDTHHSKTRGIDIQQTKRLSDMYQLIWGINGQEHKLNSSTSGKHSYNIKALYLQNKFNISEFLQIDSGARIDDYSNFGTEFNPSISLLYWPDEGKKTKFHALIARAFRAPTFNDLYWPATSWAEGNPNLKPEKGICGEIGISGQLIHSQLEITYFRNDLDDLINWAEGSDNIWRPSNINSAITEGIELKTKTFPFKNLEMELNYTYLRAKDDKRDKYLTYRPKHKLYCRLRFKELLGYMIEIDGQYTTKRFTDTLNTDHLDDYFIMNLNLSKLITKKLKIYVSINNLLNRAYETKKGYPMPGFSISGGCKITF